MARYQFIKKKPFEGLTKFEKRLNDMVDSNWRVIGMSSDSGEIVVLLERSRSDF